MKNDRETRKKLLESAEKEFTEKGYSKASLRKICADAGVTTGALYFFFKNKDDLFRSVVEPPLSGLIKIISVNLYYETEQDKAGNPNAFARTYSAENHSGLGPLIRYIYSFRSIFLILLTQSQGSAYENVIDQIVELTEKGYRVMAEKMAERAGSCHIDEYMLHWLVHMNIDTFVHLITHEPDTEKAVCHMDKIMKHLVELWFDIILVKDK